MISRIRDRDSMTPIAVMMLVAASILLLYSQFAHGAPAPTTAPADAPFPWTAIPWEAWAIAGLAALAGLETLLKGAAMTVRAVSKLTTTTVDDHIADGLEAADAKFVEALGILRGLRGQSGPTPPAPGRSPLAPVAILALLVGLAGAAALPSCGGSQNSRAATIGSLDSGVGAAIASLRTYEHVKAEAVVASATSLDEGKAALRALRARTAPAWRAIDTAIAALDAANTINDDPSLRGAQTALANAIAAITALTGGTSP